MFPLESHKQIQLTRLVADYNRTSRYEREIADRLKEADFARSAALAAPPQPQPRHAGRLDLRAFIGRLARRATAQA